MGLTCFKIWLMTAGSVRSALLWSCTFIIETDLLSTGQKIYEKYDLVIKLGLNTLSQVSIFNSETCFCVFHKNSNLILWVTIKVLTITISHHCFTVWASAQNVVFSFKVFELYRSLKECTGGMALSFTESLIIKNYMT